MSKIDAGTVYKDGMSLGGVIAIAISWGTNHSIFWAICHGIFSWGYVIYYAITR